MHYKLLNYLIPAFCGLIKFLMDIIQGPESALEGSVIKRDDLHFFFLNIGHFLDHLFVLIFATAVIKRAVEWDLA